MNIRSIWNKGVFLAGKWLETKSALIDQESVIKGVYLDVEVGAGYFLSIVIANLIALSGLLVNNTAVIIGAMLISPLMGPILSSGFAFVTGNPVIGQKAFRKLAMSVVLTIAIAAIATYISPLKEITAEIASRTRPNLFDLIVAFLAGTAGAIALCTKKNYLTVVPGVAIATAVIPPLSVAGYGLGSAHYAVALGGFFLFFTNLVAIIISTCIVFFIFGFRPGMLTEANVTELKKRFIFLGTVFVIICIPLVYTLHESISSVRLGSSVQAALKARFDKEKVSHLVEHSHVRRKDGVLDIFATVNTATYLNDAELTEIEKGIEGHIAQDVNLNVEQVLVKGGGLKPESVRVAELVAEPAPVAALTGMSGAIRKVSIKMEKIIAPAVVDKFYVGYQGNSPLVPVYLTVRRDAPFTEDESKWLGRMVEEALGVKVDFKVEVVPFFDPLVFSSGATELTDDMKRVLAFAADILHKDSSAFVSIVSYPDAAGGSLARIRAQQVVDLLGADYKVAGERMETEVSRQSLHRPEVRVLIRTRKASD